LNGAKCAAFRSITRSFKKSSDLCIILALISSLLIFPNPTFSMPEHIIIFQDRQIRRTFIKDKWFFSVVDIIETLTESDRPRKYWADLKKKLKKEGSELSDKIGQLKMFAEDGKMRETDVVYVEQAFRLIQSIPSPKAEPFKLWLSKVGYERLQEINDPELSINRARENYKKHGRTNAWIQQRMMGQETRNKLTDHWKSAGVSKEKEFAILTNIIHQEWTDLSVQKHKELKGLKSQNLRDHMSEAELILTALAEMSTREISASMESQGFAQNKIPAKRGGAIAKKARLDLEDKTKRSVITGKNYLK
jgi:DNA-damage-inducible protein D